MVSYSPTRLDPQWKETGPLTFDHLRKNIIKVVPVYR